MLLKSPVKFLSVNSSPEIELLLICACTSMDSEKAERLKALLQEEIEWENLLQMATQHKVIPLLYCNLNTICPEAVPQNILDRLQKNYYTDARRNLFLSGELVRLLQLFESQEILALPFKGPILAASAYGNLSLRQFCDLDILIREKDIEKAKALFLSQGYKMKIERIEVTPQQEAAFVRSQNIHHFVREAAYPFIHEQKKILVELHWGIVPKYFSFPLDSEELWENLEQVSIASKSVPNLSPENALLMICGHGTKDCWRQLARICDVAELIRSYPLLDWTKLMQRAKILGGQRMLYLGLFLAKNLLGTTLPDSVYQKIKADPEVEILATQVCDCLFCNTNESSKHGNVTRFHLRAKENLADKLKYFLLITITPTTTDWLLLPLAKFPAFIYYLMRPIRLGGKQALKVFKRIFS
ncbi:nucleotidyltransferase family protein [Aerosakkonema funiforme]|uniref:nucleotidyltransferase domain-containing protein n=1 Tax=Aerosakkonema funiforme TaxID=1246630 RepID=UPI0035B89DE1